MKNTRKIGLAVAGLLCVSGALASANTITFVGTGGATGSRGPVSAQAVVTTGSNSLTIALSNTITGIVSAGQLLSDFSISLSNGNVSTASVVSGSGNLINVAGDGSFTSAGSTTDAGWKLTTSSSSLTLSALGGTNGPAYTVIGPPCPTTPNPTYCDANGSIAGNSAHNPFVTNPLTFDLLINGVTANTTVSNVIFSFGTTAGDDINGIPQTSVPEPGTFALAGLVLVGIGCLRKRFFKKN